MQGGRATIKKSIDPQASLAGSLAAASVAGLIFLGSRNLHYFDWALLPYALATIFSAAAIAYRYTVWLQRPPTWRYWQQSWRLFWRNGLLRNIGRLVGLLFDNFATQRFIGQRSPATGKVYLPSKGYDPIERVRMTERDDVGVADTGTVVAYTVITPVQYYGQQETEPYIRASILLDGADQPLGQQDIRTLPIAEFRSGLRLRAVWKPKAERSVDEVDNRWGGTGAVIARWEPTGEPDVPFEKLAEHNW